ncbi:(+)-neomenthol dehydrogenase [Camellia lanceoleosa]|nr:(+)-neomenthol dehydrogenase [Camellia lanceoleosa]
MSSQHSASIASLADYIKTKFGKLNILVNNAGINGVIVDAEAFASLNLKDGEVLSKGDKLAEEKVDEVVNQFLKDVKEDMLETKRWPINLSTYVVSKAALKAYSRILATKFLNF